MQRDSLRTLCVLELVSYLRQGKKMLEQRKANLFCATVFKRDFESLQEKMPPKQTLSLQDGRTTSSPLDKLLFIGICSFSSLTRNAKLKVDELSLGCNDLASKRRRRRQSRLATFTSFYSLASSFNVQRSSASLFMAADKSKPASNKRRRKDLLRLPLFLMQWNYLTESRNILASSSIERLCLRAKSIDHTQKTVTLCIIIVD